jgi:hypothetical protein
VPPVAGDAPEIATFGRQFVEHRRHSPRVDEHAEHGVLRLVCERREHVGFGGRPRRLERGFERTEFVKPPFDTLVTPPPELVFEIPTEPISRLCHRPIVEQFSTNTLRLYDRFLCTNIRIYIVLF